MKILVTGAAGFIGYHLCEALISKGYEVVGLDNINGYYDINLKYARLKQLGVDRKKANIYHTIVKSELYGNQMQFIRMNLQDRVELPKLFLANSFDIVCNLAAQAGVRYSLENPEVFVDSNLVGFLNLLECCRHHKVKRLVYASSSSVYGNSDVIPFQEAANVDRPISMYAATKKSNELMAHAYSHLYEIETIGLRFFTVYGPWGRPDMAMFLFTDAILNNKPIKVFNNGDLFRDFTYIDDIIEGVVNTLLNTSRDKKLYKLYNIGNNEPVKLMNFIVEIEKTLDIKAKKRIMPMQHGDVKKTWANTNKIFNDYNYYSKTSIQKGINEFIKWYKLFYVSKKIDIND